MENTGNIQSHRLEGTPMKLKLAALMWLVGIAVVIIVVASLLYKHYPEIVSKDRNNTEYQVPYGLHPLDLAFPRSNKIMIHGKQYNLTCIGSLKAKLEKEIRNNPKVDNLILLVCEYETQEEIPLVSPNNKKEIK